MRLGKYDSATARNRAARFLAASIGEMCQLMSENGMEPSYSGESGHPEGSIEYNAFRMASSEYSALQNLKLPLSDGAVNE